MSIENLDNTRVIYFLSPDLIPKNLAPLGVYEMSRAAKASLRRYSNFDPAHPLDYESRAHEDYWDGHIPTARCIAERADLIVAVAVTQIEETRVVFHRCSYGILLPPMPDTPWLLSLIERRLSQLEIPYYYKSEFIGRSLDESLIENQPIWGDGVRQMQIRYSS